jgi:tetratricopeptide (TPR) repeat protein
MKGRYWLLALATASTAAIPLQPHTVLAQEASARFRVLVPVVLGEAGADKKFGERFAQELRSLINDMPTHQPIEEREIKSSLRQYDLKAEDLTCARIRQLGQLISAQLVFCGSYAKEGTGFRVQGEFWTPSSESFQVEAISVAERGQKEAAQHFYQALQVQSEQIRYAQFCGDYATSQLWEQALSACDQAITLNPNTVDSRYTRAIVLERLDRKQEALDEFKRVLERDALNENAMQHAGFLSATLGFEDDARRFYRSYLELNPANARVRMSVAYDLASAGDPLGAMQFIQTGLDLDPENVDLLIQHGGFAFAAGAKIVGDQELLPVEAAELFRAALASYDKVYAAKGAETDVGQLRSMMAAHSRLQDYEGAISLGERVLQTHPDEPIIWSYYADALQKTGKVTEAVTALERVLALDPAYPNAVARQAQWLFEQGRQDDAVAALRQGVQRGSLSSDDAALRVFAVAYQRAIQPQQWEDAVRLVRLAKEFPVNDENRQQLDFWLGYSLYQRARVQQEAQTLQTAQATLPQFQEAMRLIQSCGGYAQKNNLESNRQQIQTATQTYIEIQEAIIKRGR